MVTGATSGIGWATAEALAKEMIKKNPKLLNKQPPSLPQVPLGFSIFNLLA